MTRNNMLCKRGGNSLTSIALRIPTPHDFRVIIARTCHGRVHIQNVRDFFQVFAKNNLIKNIFEEEKKFNSGTRFFFGTELNSSQLGVFWPRRGLHANHGTVRKSQYSSNQGIKNS